MMADMDDLSTRRLSKRGKQSDNIGFEGRGGTLGAPICWMIKALLDVNQKEGCLRVSLGHDVLVPNQPLWNQSYPRDRECFICQRKQKCVTAQTLSDISNATDIYGRCRTSPVQGHRL